ncbi:DUF3185 family protein [Flavobacterium orientale]|jgi:uncharacterized membrane protein YidH (DUF202 family)|uniref:Uncharacterized protein n=1 Tax=Flavobacterium orientale TaxID=1756020 RepID=A0A916XVM9_9FLAO|nr:DUF3185 family protein [Flavobacterium orientale]GGD14257.1 hypothetical protein GCM10011343_01660 [Flavobacterium orientale]
MDSKKIISLVLIGVGVALLIYGMNHMDSASSQIGELFGKTDNKGMISMIIGGVLAVAGLVTFLKKKS